MSQKKLNQEEVIVADAVSKTEQFFEKNGKWCVIALVVLLLGVGCGYAYKHFVWDKNVAEAAEMIIIAEERFSGTTPDFALALNGDDAGAGFLAVAEQYGSTPAGNIAKHYAGICYLRLGDLDNAAKYLASYKSVKGIANEVVNAQNYGLQGDIAVEKGNYAEAAKLFAKAVKASDNAYTAPLYMYKKGCALKAANEIEQAKACFETLVAKYPAAVESREAQKALGTL